MGFLYRHLLQLSSFVPSIYCRFFRFVVIIFLYPIATLIKHYLKLIWQLEQMTISGKDCYFHFINSKLYTKGANWAIDVRWLTLHYSLRAHDGQDNFRPKPARQVCLCRRALPKIVICSVILCLQVGWTTNFLIRVLWKYICVLYH